ATRRTGFTDGICTARNAITTAYTDGSAVHRDLPSFPTRRSSDLTENTATAAYVNLLDTGGTDWTAVLDTFDASSSTVKGQVRLGSDKHTSEWLTLALIRCTPHSGYREFPLTTTGSTSANPFANGD